MNKADALHEAKNALFEIIKEQPNLLSYAGLATNEKHGENAAKFCISFIETYGAWLETQAK
ncbi:hypothetical protein [Herbaspirillum autotrophicum]|uniref:hypothetical protein n=1 Tax=Herbaspirillum autotrophicum TaxID=180195 RepID=UPI00067B30AA|nr:hypothetical protein [Herbaspirillum autotrophicum]